jgi:hypothetical protein
VAINSKALRVVCETYSKVESKEVTRLGMARLMLQARVSSPKLGSKLQRAPSDGRPRRTDF